MKDVVDTLGRPLRDLRISLTDRCNFRCSYCMPKEVFGPDYAFLPKSALLSGDEIVSLARCFAALGIQKVRLTGGEPLLRPDLVEIVRRIAGEIGVPDVSLTTNGSLLPRYARALKDAGLARVNVSLDSLDPARFRLMSGDRSSPETVLRGIDAAEAAGLPVKINMVAKRGANEQDILSMVAYFRERRMTLRFIEFMDVGETNHWRRDEVVPEIQILNTIRSAFEFEPVDPEYRGEVAARYRFTDNGVEFGIITSITQPFCRDCNRARLSADGKLYTCLFATQGADIKAFMRGGATASELTERIAQIWGRRKDRYSEERSAAATKPASGQKIEMSYIGG